MNGQIAHLCRIVVSARETLYKNSDIVFNQERYVHNNTFTFLHRTNIPETTDSVEGWFNTLLYITNECWN